MKDSMRARVFRRNSRPYFRSGISRGSPIDSRPKAVSCMSAARQNPAIRNNNSTSCVLRFEVANRSFLIGPERK